MNGHCVNSYYYHLITILLQWQTLILLTFSSSTETQLELTTPVNPVKEGGLLSVHCQVWGLQSHTHQVTILRQVQGDKIEILSLDEGVLNQVDDRVFLAIRQLNDGSNVYFLSITQVTRQDEGQYVCKIEKKGITNEVIAVESADVAVMYFPTMTPSCKYKSSLEVRSGTTVTLNCTAELSNPGVNIEWIYGGTKQVIKTEQLTGSKITYSELHVTLSAKDNNRVFLCQIWSPIFPGEQEACHIGPFTVIPSPGEEQTLPVTQPSRKDDNKLNTDLNQGRKSTVNTFDRTKCSKVCTVDASRQFPWIIAFVAAVVLTILFIVIGILLYVSYIRASKAHNVTATSLSRRRHPDDIYSELDIKPMDTKVYMPLEFRDKFGPMDRQSIHYSDIPKM